MDNMLLSTTQFLFVPESALSVVFLVIFCTLFVLGLYWASNCRKTVEEWAENGGDEYDKVRDKMPAEIFVRKQADKNSSEEAKLEGLPDVFVSVGIIGTFLGLGVAIQGAANLLQDEKIDLSKLTAVLGIIAFKFQTSVWGIGLSLLFRRFVVETYLDFRQNTLDVLLETVYAKERAGIRALLEKQNELLTVHFALLAKEGQEKKQLASKRLDTLLDLLRSLSQARYKFWREGLAGLNDSLKTMNKENVAKLSELQTNIVNQFTEQKQTADQHIKFVADKLDDVTAQMATGDKLKLNMAEQGMKAFLEFSHSTGEFNQTAQDFTQASEKFAGDVVNFENIVTDFFREEFARIRQVNDTLVKRQEEHIARIREEHKAQIVNIHEHQTDKMDKIKEEQTANLYQLVNGLDELHQKFYQDSRRFVADTQKIFADKIESVLDNVHNEYVGEARAIRVSVEEAERILRDMGESIKNVNEEALSGQRNFARRQENTAAQVDATMNNLAERIGETLTALSTQTEKYMATMADTQAQMQKNIQDWQNANKLSDSLRKIEGELAQQVKDVEVDLTEWKRDLDADHDNQEMMMMTIGQALQESRNAMSRMESKLNELKDAAILPLKDIPPVEKNSDRAQQGQRGENES